jgi:16S rRNA processing protein RimM
LRVENADVVVVGRVGKPHGLNGAFFVDAASDDPQWFEVGATLHALGREMRVAESKRSGGRVVIRLDADVERGTQLCVPRAALPPPGEDEYYVADLIGLEVEEEGGRSLGRVTSVEPYEANDVLELDSGIALPLVEDCVQQVDLAGGRIVIARGFVDPG